MLAVLLVAALAGCAGDDLKKEFFTPTTVPLEPGSGGTGTVPEGPINEPSVAIEKLREVDPCALIPKEVLSELGTAQDPTSSFNVDECSATITDAGGKSISARLKLGDSVVWGADGATGGIEGLPLIESSHDKKSCFVTAMTSKDPALGLTMQMSYEGGEPCVAGRKILTKVIQKLKGGAPKLTIPKGSLIPIDPCASANSTVAEEISGAEKKSLTGLHGCSWFGGRATVSVDFRFSYPPEEEKGSKVVDLGGGVKAFSRAPSPDIARCTVTWAHLERDKDTAEIVNVDYSNYTGGEKPAKACEKAIRLAKTVVPTLPKS